MNDDIWHRFETMLLAHAPPLFAGLNAPATEAQVAAAEDVMGVIFPAEVRIAYLRHDGTSREARIGASRQFFFPMNWWASLAEMVDNWQMKVSVCKELQHPEMAFPSYEPWWDDLEVRPVWWDKKWIPIGLSDTATSVYFDLNPAPKGTGGQLIVDHGMQDPYVIASGLNHYLETLTDRVERKLLIFREGWVLADPDQSVFGERGYEWNAIG